MKQSHGAITLDSSKTICIGHGMGAHVCGMAGQMDKEYDETTRRKNRENRDNVQSVDSAGQSIVDVLSNNVRKVKNYIFL